MKRFQILIEFRIWTILDLNIFELNNFKFEHFRIWPILNLNIFDFEQIRI
jgi:hypothetical protein